MQYYILPIFSSYIFQSIYAVGIFHRSNNATYFYEGFLSERIMWKSTHLFTNKMYLWYNGGNYVFGN